MSYWKHGMRVTFSSGIRFVMTALQVSPETKGEENGKQLKGKIY